MTYRHATFFLAGVCACLMGCRQKSGTLFTIIPASHSHIDFKNNIEEDIDFNILTYEYLYNGGGVATGDVNGDGLTDIFFTGNMVKNKLYLNKGNFEFEDITESAGITGRNRWKTGTTMADVNGDGLIDIYVCYSGPGTDEQRANELYINNGNKKGKPTFTESAKKYGLDAPGTYSTAASFFDMDNDGDLDMFLVNHADMFYNPFYNTDTLRAARHPKFGNRLYKNDAGHFTDISEQAGIKGSGLNFGLSVATSDINDDGYTDIYVTNDYDERDFLYINQHDGTYREVLDKAAKHFSEFAMGSDIADYNNDGKPDIMALDMLPEDNHRQKLLKGADTYDKYSMRAAHGFGFQQMRNTLQLNNGTDSSGIPILSEVGQLAGVYATDWSWSPLLADFDNDGWKDLFISNGIFKDITNLDFVKYTSGYNNNFTDSKGDKKAMWQLIKEMPSTKLRNYFFRNNKNLGFSNVSETWGLDKEAISNGSAYADLDNDGDLDLVINCINDEPTLLQNNTSENKGLHYLQITLKGNLKNTLGIGAKVLVATAHSQQLQEQYISRGFQSSVDPVMHIGLGTDSIVTTLTVKWPGGKSSILKNVKSNQHITITESFAKTDTIPAEKNKAYLFTDVTATSGINYKHKSSSFVDFKLSPLLPWQISKTGACITKADVNGDGLEDVFIGATREQPAVLYLQNTAGNFTMAATQPWMSDNTGNSTDALFFDADNDGDNDLYIVNGGADDYYNSKTYQDKLYQNDGRGNFRCIPDALPPETISGSCARAADINHDGLPDLFVGGSLTPGFFPETPESFILVNKSTRNHLQFEKDYTQKDSTLSAAGMVTDALWTDLNKDGWQDLVVVGQFMPITIFENHKGRLLNKTKAYGLDETYGWWTRITSSDFDKDGNIDFVVGNLGLNSPFKASVSEPLSITYSDFNNDGVLDPILCYYNHGKSYPWFTRDEIFSQLPALQKRFGRYKDYADAQLTDMFSKEQLAAAHTVKIVMLQSVYISNKGNKNLEIKPLPMPAQISVVNGIVPIDINKDGKLDIVMAGNFYPLRVQTGPIDAGIGLWLKGDGKGNFSPEPFSKTGLKIEGDVRNLIAVKTNDGARLIAAKNNIAFEVIKPK
jgi:hypothetical protein